MKLKRKTGGVKLSVLTGLFCVPIMVVSSLALTAQTDETGYRLTPPAESEFDNVRDSAAPPPKPEVASGEQEYEDTEFGEFLYSEGSLATKLEMLRLLSKQTPPTQVFLHAISMGVGVDEMLRASASYSPGQARSLAVAAVSVLPLVDQSPKYNYSGYELEDIERDEEPIYLASDVIERFFDDRSILRPQPDWLEGQIHFDARAQELWGLVSRNDSVAWYFRTDKATKELKQDRPVFISLYEIDKTVRIDGAERVMNALAVDPQATLPVVFIFNRVNEIALDQLTQAGYPTTVRGVRDAYVEKTLMLTPVPEWDVGEHHLQAELTELDELFDLPREEDFEPEYWQKLLTAARQYSVDDTSFLIVVMPNANRDELDDEEREDNYSINFSSAFVEQVASWDNPRSEEAFPYVEPGSDGNDDEKDQDRRNEEGDFLGDGLILNRPDLIAALFHLREELNITTVPVAFYYVDSARVKSFLRGPRALTAIVENVYGRPPGGGNGGFGPPPDAPPECASPPCARRIN
jgi:hypothetical protein